MLSNLRIENIAVIKEAVIDFKNGFNVMTGETGAGKSIVIDSINAILGERTSRELIRTGSKDALVCAEFTNITQETKDCLNDFDIEEDDTLIIQRKISEDGKNSCRINGTPVNVSMLKKIGRSLVDIHGQLDNQALLSPDFHCSFVDKIAENDKLLSEYQTIYFLYQEKCRELNALQIDESEKNRRIDLLNYQIEEIESANLKVGEFDELQNQLDFMRNAEKITNFLNSAYAKLNGDENEAGAVSETMHAAEELQSASSYSKEFEEIYNGINDAAYALSAFTDELRDKLYSLDFDPSEINVVEERLDTIYQLFSKYGKTEQEVLDYLQKACDERDKIAYSDEHKEKLVAEIEIIKSKALEKATLLSDSRKKAGEIFSRNVAEELAFLEMPSVKFLVQQDISEMNENGIDTIEFLLSANAGEVPKPLCKVASGGELSRIMLAIKSVLAEKDAVSTLIFDEIDTGVSGRSALKIAAKMKALSKSHQVICVTHLAQIAAYADEHFIIEKQEVDDKTYTQVTLLDYNGRKYELARIMGGLTVSDSILASADELLKSAKA